MKRWFQQLLVRNAGPPPRRRRVTPRVEALEDRLAPAVHTWDAGSPFTPFWSDAANWGATGVPTTGEADGTIVVIPINKTPSIQDITGLVIDQLQFTNSGFATVTLATPLGIDGSVIFNNIVSTSTSGLNTITGSSLTLSGNACVIDLATNAVIMNIASQITGNQGILKVGAGVLILSTAVGNTYTGTTRIEEGYLFLRTDTADAGLSNTIVVGNGTGAASSATLELATSFQIPDFAAMTINSDGRVVVDAGVTEDLTTLTLNGGVLDIKNTGTFAIRAEGSVTTTATATGSTIEGSGSFRLNITTTFTIADGAAATDLRISATVTEGFLGSRFIKTGAGTLELAGTNANTYTGGTTVNEGVLALNNDAIDGAVSKSLVIGDSTGAAGSAVVRLLRPSEIPDDGTIAIHSDGRLDLNGRDEAIGLLTLDGGSSVTTGPGSLTLFNNVIVNAAGASSPATMTGNLSLAGSIRTFTVADRAAAVDLQIDAIVFGGGLIKDGAGRMVLTGANTYSGTTTVNAGVLQVDGSQPTSAVSLAGGTLAGGGTVGPIAATGGTIAPGLLTVSAPVVLRSGNLALGAATFTPLISGTVGGVADQIAVTGTVNLTGATLTPTRTGTPVPGGQSIVLISNDGTDPIVGTFAGLPQGATVTVNGQLFTVSYTGGDGNDVWLTALTNPPPAPPAPPPPVVQARAIVAALVTKKVGRTRRLFVRVSFADTEALKAEVRSPFQTPAFRGIVVSVFDSDGDGVADTVRLTARKGKKTLTRLVAL
jgi:fibronectin-binding autotransporter adhesin